jgi:glyoxylase-like metal-dependent hydrolase (beta-lactamase superfamily II)
MLVLERGWLSANNIVFLEGEQATLVDSGYVTHAEQTVELVNHAVDGRRLARLINTHSHSDHIGGNAALQARFGCAISVPAGLHATIAEWDENALLLSPLGQQAARFQHDNLIRAGDEVEMGGLNWQALAVPGHDMEALAYYNPERRILISGDALWENGFGVIFPELLGEADGLSVTRETLEMLARLPIDIVIPGHGSPFTGADAAFERAFRRVDSFAADIDKLVWHAIKVIVSFAMLERRRLPAGDFPAFLLSLPFCVDLNTRYLNMADDVLAARIERELLLVNALRREDGFLVAG